MHHLLSYKLSISKQPQQQILVLYIALAGRNRSILSRREWACQYSELIKDELQLGVPSFHVKVEWLSILEDQGYSNQFYQLSVV